MRFNVDRYWYSRSLYFINYLLLPLSWLFGLCVRIRRKLYRLGFLSSQRFSVPVIVVGNITVGGTGKTPFVIWLANFLRKQGYHPGIVSRGAGGKRQDKPRRIHPSDSVGEVGDEAILLATRSNCPVVIGIHRADAVKHLLSQEACDVIISDDGLQHYRLQRDIEMVLIDGERRFGNHQLLPAGPLREPLSRLAEADMVLVKNGDIDREWVMSLQPLQLVSLKDKATKPLKAFQAVHAVAGIGHPHKFFTMLETMGVKITPHVFPDHYRYQAKDLSFNDNLPIIMTEKDAVKCFSFADEKHWYLDVAINVDGRLQDKLLTLLQNKSRGKPNEVKSSIN